MVRQTNAINAIAIQPDGKILAAGGNGDGGDTAENFVVVRYQTGGALDTTFGNAGVAFGNSASAVLARGIALQPDGKIVEVGPATTRDVLVEVFGVVRFNGNGTPDATFGAGGKAGDFPASTGPAEDGIWLCSRTASSSPW